MLLFGFGAMNGFCGANVVSLAGSGRPGDAAPLNAGNEGGGGAEAIGAADAEADNDNVIARQTAPHEATVTRLLDAMNADSTRGEIVLSQCRSTSRPSSTKRVAQRATDL
jgi:hypothetical protein